MWIGNIELRTNVGTVTIPVRSKYTVIQGNSGTGKTTLVDSKRLHYNIKTTHVITSTSDFLQFLDSSIPIGVMDEDLVLGLEECASQMNDSNKQFVFIARFVPKLLAIDYRDIYDFVSYKRTYACVRKYPDFEKFTPSPVIICEDSKSSKFYLDTKFDDVRPAYGNSNIWNVVCEIPDCTVVADGAAIGSYVDDLVELGVHLFLPASYEYLCLHREFNYNLDNELYSRWRPEEYSSLERLFTHDLHELTNENRSIYGEAYSKKKTQPWINRIPWQKLFDLGQSDFEQWLQRFAYPEDIGKPMAQLWEKYKHVYNLGKKVF